jgi:hypothetical protein
LNSQLLGAAPQMKQQLNPLEAALKMITRPSASTTDLSSVKVYIESRSSRKIANADILLLNPFF